MLLSYYWTTKARAEKNKTDLINQGIVNNAFIWMLFHVFYFCPQKTLLLQMLRDKTMNLN